MERAEAARLTCARVADEGLAEDYLLDQLDEERRQAFEEHFFACDACLERLEALKLARAALRPGTAAGAPARRAPGTRWTWLAAAASLAAVGVMTWHFGTAPVVAPTVTPAPVGPPSASLPARVSFSELGRFEPPPYRPPALRSAPGAAQAKFRGAMRRYQQGDLRGALSGLEQAVRADPAPPEALFFRGVCQLVLGDVAGGNESLRRVIAAGDTPYLEWGHVYLARGLLLADEPQAALAQLDAAVALEGDLEADARRLASQVKAALEPR